ncbi:MAG: hypothetical protein HYR64_09590 [Fimbriimonas ginsengisoli]|uniref:Uncharacterized protein n=1 Tax=Fimbriimonas ginsengisoli TaxID=1005039 RepID=A0A931LW63_FIMGI|nr:hypothetical protein [Fimbriimonas ginsengisoli]
MERSLRLLLEGVIDYAGLFPPAKLDMEAAVEEYLELVQGEHAWLVSRFACSASHLGELAAELEKYPLAGPVPVAVIGSASKDRHHWEAGLVHDVHAVSTFRSSAGRRASMEAFEAKAPDNRHIETYLREVEGIVPTEIFIELPWEDGMEESLAAIAESDFAYAKARTGGIEPSMYPSVPELAGFLQQCAQLDLPFKLTAGLHHPLPTHDTPTGGHMHGFLNVLAATTLCAAHDLSRREIEALLETDEPSRFRFTDSALAWGGFEASLAEIEAGRDLFLSFGSCSVLEPVEGLASAGFVRLASADR